MASRHERKEKKHKSHKHKSHKKHSKKHDKHHHKKRGKEEDVLAQAKLVLERENKRHGAPELEPEDFLNRQPEFRVWLYQNKNKCVSDVEKKKAKEYFEKFRGKWNKGELPEKFYTGIPQSVIDLIPRTATRAWNFKKTLSAADKAAITKARDSVESYTLTDKITRSLEFTPWSERKRKASAADKTNFKEVRKEAGNNSARAAALLKSIDPKFQALRDKEAAQMDALRALIGNKKIKIAARENTGKAGQSLVR